MADNNSTAEDDPTIGLAASQKKEAGSPADETLGDASAEPGNTAVKDPSEWVTGDEAMTGAQKSYLDTLAREAGEELPADLTKAQASEHIDRLQEKTGRGKQ